MAPIRVKLPGHKAGYPADLPVTRSVTPFDAGSVRRRERYNAKHPVAGYNRMSITDFSFREVINCLTARSVSLRKYSF